MMTNVTHSVLYIGVTGDLAIRVQQHRQAINADSFTAKYKCFKLVYFENFLRIEEAIAKEKRLKNWHREWKINLINASNPHWVDLTETLY